MEAGMKLFKQEEKRNTNLTGDTKVCVPIMGKNKRELLSQARDVVKMKPDIVEWRVDYLDISNKAEGDYYIHLIAKKIRNILKDIPLIYTFRTKEEGGEKSITWDLYKKYIVSAICYGDADFYDVEMYRNKDRIYELFDDLKEVDEWITSEYKIIGSNHYFDKTPSVEEMKNILLETKELGANICKLAVMPKNKADVEKLIEVSRETKKELDVPIITMSMGELGAVTRVCTKETGSCITFASGNNASAPGQIKIDIIRKLMTYNRGCTLSGNIALIGFMGTGKTTISMTLAEITGFEEVDVDAYIVKKEGMAISEIFEKNGEEYFRKIETNAIREICENKSQIISCGGGAVLKDENVSVLKENGVIALLTATPETIFDRVKDHTHRPVLNNDMSLEHIKKLMEEREPRYQSVADMKINVDGNDRVMTCYVLLSQLEKKGIVS